MSKKVGILALQGCVEPHICHIQRLGAEAVCVREAADLSSVDALIIPGGESTTMLRLMAGTGLEEEIVAFKARGPIWGICAGAILLASEVVSPSQRSFSLLPIRATRNAYGSQTFSFKAHVESPWDQSLKCVDFIRAPKLEPLSEDAEVLMVHEKEPVLLQYRKDIVSAFHTELGEDPWLHEYFLDL